MGDNKVSEGENVSRGIFDSDSMYSKLILLRDCIEDLTSDASSLHGFINNVSNEIYVNDEKIKSML